MLGSSWWSTRTFKWALAIVSERERKKVVASYLLRGWHEMGMGRVGREWVESAGNG